jgi:MFS family permease
MTALLTGVAFFMVTLDALTPNVAVIVTPQLEDPHRGLSGQQRGSVIGLWGGIAGVGAASGPLIGGAVAEGPSWQWIFLVNVPVGVAALIASCLPMPVTSNPWCKRATGIGSFKTTPCTD